MRYTPQVPPDPTEDDDESTARRLIQRWMELDGLTESEARARWERGRGDMGIAEELFAQLEAEERRS